MVAAKVCTNTKKDFEKQGASIGAYGLLVDVVSHVKENNRQGAQRPMGGCCALLDVAGSIPTSNSYAPMFPPCFLILLHTLAALEK